MENIFKICGFNEYLKIKRIKKDGLKTVFGKSNFSKNKLFIF